MNKLTHFLSLDDYYNINGEFTANINCRAINESTDKFSNDIEKLMKIQNQNILVINDINFAERMSINNNVVCIYFNKKTKLPVGSNVKFEFVQLKNKGNDIHDKTKAQLDDIFSKYSDLIFGFIFNISPDTQFPLTYEIISNLILYIFESSVYVSGITEFWSFDELDVVEQFNKKIYKLHEIRPRGVNRIDFSEWIKYGFDEKDEKDRFMNVIIEKDDDTFYKKDLDKTDYLGATENTDDEHILKSAIEPMIYAFQTDVVDKLLNIHSLKVGDTDRGVDVRLKEWNKDYPGLVEQGRWSSVISGLGEALDGKVFRDKTLHKIITNNIGRRNVGTEEEIKKLELHKIHYSNEFFENCTTQDIEDAIKILYDLLSKNRIDILSKLKDKNNKTKEFIYPLHNKSLPYSARELQQKVIDKFKDRFENNYKQMLIYAVMRFGKTFVACECAKYFCEKKHNGRFILVVSSKTEVKNEWLGQINPYNNYINIDMYDSSNTNSGLLHMLHNKKEWIDSEKTIPGPHPGKIYETVDDYLKDYPNKNIMLFASLNDLDGNRQNFNKGDGKEATDEDDYIKFQHQCFYDTPIDMIIIDEAHTGAEADSFGFAIGEGDKKDEKKLRKILKEEEKDGVITKKKFNEMMKTLKIENAIKLFLSGTPYNLLYDEHFTEDEIIGKFSFADLMKAKEEWIEKEEKKYEGDDVHIQRIDYSKNPYYGIPEMLNFGYNFNSFKLDQMKKMGVEYNFKTLFKTDGKKFDFEEDILNLFMAIDGSKKRNGVMDLLNLAEIRKGNMCKHIVIVLPLCKTCDAMELFLKKYKKKLKNLGQYEIINISGKNNNVNDDSEIAKKMIYNFDKSGNKTISLTVNKLLTGVTVKPWDTMFYMKDGLSAQSYDQAKFRIQTPYIKEVPEIDISDDVKSVSILKNEKGEPIKRKIDMKPQTIFVDFSADRIFTLLHKRYIAELGARGITTESDGFESAYDALATKDLKYLPIISTETGKLKRIESKNIHEIIRTSLAHVYFSKSLNDLIAGIKWPVPVDKDIDNIEDCPEIFDDKKKGKKNIKIETASEDGDDFDTKNVDSDETPTIKPGRKPWKRMTPEEKKELLYHFRKKCQTIMMNFAIYLLTRKDNTKILTWKSLFGDSMRNVDNIIDEDGNKIMRDGINVDIIINIFGDGIIPENFDERQEKVNKIKRELQYWKDYYLTKSPGLREEVLNRLVAMTGKYGENRNNFNKIKDSLKSFANLGKTEFITPDDLSKKLLENVVIFNKNSKILDCYGSKIGEILNYISSDSKYSNDFNLSNYYLIVKNSMIAEICKVTFNIVYEKQKKWNITHSSNKNKKFFELVKEDGSIDYRGTLTNREKDKFFNDHILIFNTLKEEKKEKEKETSEASTEITESIEQILEARGEKTRIKEREKTYYIELENAINNKWGENMKFDIIVGNPPYKGALHYKILNTIKDTACNNDSKISWISPDIFADYMKIKESPKGLVKLEHFNNKEASNLFGGHIQTSNGLSISYYNFSSNDTLSIEDISIIENWPIEGIHFANDVKSNIKVSLNDKIETYNNQKYFCPITIMQKVDGGSNRANIICDIGVLTNGCIDGVNYKKIRKNGGKSDEDRELYGFSFNTYREAENCFNSFKLDFYQTYVSLMHLHSRYILKDYPYLENYNIEWTNDKLIKYFNIDDRSKKYINSDNKKTLKSLESTESKKTRMSILKENPELKSRIDHSYNIFLDAGEDYDTSFEDYVNSPDCDKYFKDYENTR